MADENLKKLAAKLSSGEHKNIVFMVGAGISTSAGIPDFRSPETGLYSNLEKLDLPYPEAVFDIDYFRKSPRAFYTLAHDLYPGKYKPTVFHRFMALIQEKGYLRRVYTQNIDTLERLAGVRDEKIVEAHGSFASHHCIDCHEEMSAEDVKNAMWGGDDKRHTIDSKQVNIPRCKNPECPTEGGGYVKPDIVFYGEGLPELFFESLEEDFPAEVDLAIIAGTSLTVHPFAQLPEMMGPQHSRVLFNNEKVGTIGKRKRDVVVLGDIDQQVERLVSYCGWKLPTIGIEEENKGDESSKGSNSGSEKVIEQVLEKVTEDLEALRVEASGPDAEEETTNAVIATDNEDKSRNKG